MADSNSNTADTIWCGFSEESQKAQQAGSLSKTKLACLPLQIQELETKLREVRRATEVWTAREQDAAAKGAQARLSTVQNITKAMRSKLPRELRDQIYEYYWNSYDKDWLRSEMPHHAFSDGSYEGHGKPKKEDGLLNNLLLQQERVGYATSQEAAMMLYAVVGCKQPFPLVLRLTEPWPEMHRELTLKALLELQTVLYRDAFKLDIIPMNHIRTIRIDFCLVGDGTKDPEHLRMVSPWVRETHKGTITYESGRKVDLQVTSPILTILDVAADLIPRFRELWNILSPHKASLSIRARQSGRIYQSDKDLNKIYALREYRHQRSEVVSKWKIVGSERKIVGSVPPRYTPSHPPSHL